MTELMQRCTILSFGLALALCGCQVETTGPGEGSAATSASGTPTQAATIVIDGSSTVAPISMAIAEIYEEQHPGLKVKVNVSGTGAGFEKFSKGETDISNASRPIKASEARAAAEHGVEFVEVMVGIDGLTVAVHPANDWCQALTVEQLAEMWKKDSRVSKWSDIDPNWPNEPIKLFGADSKSGTYDYFKEETVGKDAPMRTDYQPNTDDNVLVTGVAGDKYALGFFGYAYYAESTAKLKAVAIAPKGKTVADAILPTPATIEDGSYSPLSRPLFIYPKLEALKRPEVRELVQFHVSDEGQKLVELKKYIKLNPEQLAASRAKLQAALDALSP